MLMTRSAKSFRIAADTGTPLPAIEAVHGNDVVDQVAVNAAVSVLELMDVDKAEGEDCGGDDCIKVLRWALIKRTSRTTFLD